MKGYTVSPLKLTGTMVTARKVIFCHRTESSQWIYLDLSFTKC